MTRLARSGPRSVRGDFIYLNVRGLLDRYDNPTAAWPEIVRAFSKTELIFYDANGLLRSGFQSPFNIDDLVLRYSDFNEEGKAFIMSQSVERWLASCDRKGGIEAYRDQKGLMSRLAKFRSARKFGS